MEHPIKTIVKALGIVFAAAILIGNVPQAVHALTTEEWYLVIAGMSLLVLASVFRVYQNAGKLLLREKVKKS